ncbi:hypothetical protein F5X68DRAFT_210427 [Plectosphaerella plurivora]|uniref:Infection structure specific protein n=1 Tax=Plectosphaerella plurivora TaxID=936078 RepID=A0A9P8V6Y4_9PEZI|nr:hypothetical protein F5X68DRAFT_210427 [Plectosphaerella plurivora]
MLPAKSLLSAMTSATVTSIQVVHIIDAVKVGGPSLGSLLQERSSPIEDPRDPLAKRTTPEECTSILTGDLGSRPTPVPEIVSWLEADDVVSNCTWVAPSTISSEIFSYLTAFLDWTYESMEAIEAYATKCSSVGPEASGAVSDPDLCFDGITFHFTGTANTTATVTDFLQDYVPPTATGKAPDNAASAAGGFGVSLSSLAVAGIVVLAASL